MTFTWDSTDLSTDLALIRSRLGDTDSTNPLLTDEQINKELALAIDIDLTIANCCRNILAFLAARKTDRSGPRFNATRSQIFQHYKDLMVEYQTKIGEMAGPTWAELSIDDAEDTEDDGDFEPPKFKMGRDDNL